MKRWLPMLAAVLALPLLGGCGIATYTQADDGAYYSSDDGPDVSTFYDELAPYGDWIWTEAYGWVWSPYDEAVDWRPYSDGEWIWTDDGWTWAADQDWGWATFHYGRWYDDPTYGWCWVPGQEWGPAWVAWREGDGWIGWAPLPPEVTWNDSSGFNWSDWDHLPGVRHHWWNFVKEGDFARPDLRQRIAPRLRGVIRMRDTRNITSYALLNSRVVNRSFDVDRIRRSGGGDIPTYRIADLSAPPAGHGRQLTRDRLNAYRPRLREAPLTKMPQKVRVPRPVPAPSGIHAPEPGSVPPGRTVERDPREQRRREALDLQRRHSAERKDLNKEVRQSTQQPPPGVSPEELRRQQQEQQRALNEQIARDRRVLEARQKEEQQQAQQSQQLQQQRERELQEQQRQQLEQQRRQIEQQRQDLERQRQQLEQERQRGHQEQQPQPQQPKPQPTPPPQDQQREPNRKEANDKPHEGKGDKDKDHTDRPDRQK